MLPYVQLPSRTRVPSGWPVMRHLYLDHPQDPRTCTMPTSTCTATRCSWRPVVTRGATSRAVYLPETAYFDYWAGTRVPGRAT